MPDATPPPAAGDDNLLPALPPWSDLLRAARREVEQTLASLPAALQTDARTLPVVYEKTPEPRHGEDLDPDILGLFVGPSRDDLFAGAAPSPHIILFLHNLWDMADGDPNVFAEEVRITFMHELGHYLGLDEDELEDRGLG